MNTFITRRLLFCVGCLGLVCCLIEISQVWIQEQAAGRVAGRFRRTKIHAKIEVDGSASSIIQSAFNRDSLLQDFFVGPNKFSFNDITEVELLAANTRNGSKVSADDSSSFLRNLRSPKSVNDLVPVLVCDYVFFCVSYGSSERYSTLMQWRQAYVNQHPGACLLVFHNDGSALTDVRKVGFAFKFLDHLYLIKAISDGRIITTAKYDELLESGLMSRPTRGPPSLTRQDTTSIKEFIRLLTPHMSSGIGIPSNADMSQYPSMFYLDMDTLFTNKSITVPKFLERIDEGLKLQPILPSLKNETLSNDFNHTPYSSAMADFLISTDISCFWKAHTTLNTGVHFSRPTDTMADLLWTAMKNRYGKIQTKFGDQETLVAELRLMSDYNPSQVIAECNPWPPRWNTPEHENRIVFASALSNNSTDPDDLSAAQVVAQLNHKRNEHMKRIWGTSFEHPRGSRIPLFVVVNERWCNSMYLPQKKRSDWRPGDWIVHFTQYIKTERKVGKPLRKWICNNLDSVAHPNDWPSSPNDCPKLVERGFSYIPRAY